MVINFRSDDIRAKDVLLVDTVPGYLDTLLYYIPVQVMIGAWYSCYTYHTSSILDLHDQPMTNWATYK